MANVSKNSITIDQLHVACRHGGEMIEAGVSPNFAIRTLELFADFYGKLKQGGNGAPHHPSQVVLWSVKAKELRRTNPDAQLRVEHGTPRRYFALRVLELYKARELNTTAMDELVDRWYRLAVITLEEDRILNKMARSKVPDTPEKRWRAAGIEF